MSLIFLHHFRLCAFHLLSFSLHTSFSFYRLIVFEHRIYNISIIVLSLSTTSYGPVENYCHFLVNDVEYADNIQQKGIDMNKHDERLLNQSFSIDKCDRLKFGLWFRFISCFFFLLRAVKHVTNMFRSQGKTKYLKRGQHSNNNNTASWHSLLKRKFKSSTKCNDMYQK